MSRLWQPELCGRFAAGCIDSNNRELGEVGSWEYRLLQACKRYRIIVGQREYLRWVKPTRQPAGSGCAAAVSGSGHRAGCERKVNGFPLQDHPRAQVSAENGGVTAELQAAAARAWWALAGFVECVYPPYADGPIDFKSRKHPWKTWPSRAWGEKVAKLFLNGAERLCARANRIVRFAVWLFH